MLATIIYEKIKHIENPIGVELGVAKGATSVELLRLHSGLQLYCIDPYTMYQSEYPGSVARQHGFTTQAQFDSQFAQTDLKLRGFKGRCNLLRKDSNTMAFHFSDELFDFVFIDGNHLYEYVKNDITSWYPKVAKGGILFGHDYKPNDDNLKGNVVRAVDEIFPEAEKGSHSMWWVYKK